MKTELHDFVASLLEAQQTEQGLSLQATEHLSDIRDAMTHLQRLADANTRVKKEGEIILNFEEVPEDVLKELLEKGNATTSLLGPIGSINYRWFRINCKELNLIVEFRSEALATFYKVDGEYRPVKS